MAVIGVPVNAGSHYGSYASIIAKYGINNIGIVSNTEGETTSADMGRIDASLSFADRIIDEFLGANGYTVPVSPAPATLSDIAVDLAYTFLMQPRVYRDDQNGDGRELFFAKRDAKARLQHLAAFGMGGAVRVSSDDSRPTWTGA